MGNNNEWHVASLVVHCRPAQLAAAQQRIAALPGAEVPAAEERGKLVVLVEGASQESVISLIDKIALLDGILSTTLIYHEFAELEAGEEQV